ncbi:Hypothetical predicted protein [Lecanosticta acicola]|uniref:Diphthamide biosynthesis protein 4 n=1 Tax=Lecanosticta acicola TaxID=111012 RepID=A0AAI8Z044_9PEZI|nr:Hypothetical predicted protein [Lecanosticta acicola]
MESTKDYYRILGLQDTSPGDVISPADLRQAYKHALLLHHPDKQNLPSGKADKGVPSVDDITEAYKTLLHPKLRVEYDRGRRTANAADGDSAGKVHTRHTGMETVDLDELAMDEDEGTWIRPCRCGSKPAFVITEGELEKNIEYGELITGCKGCSLWLKVLFSVAD